MSSIARRKLDPGAARVVALMRQTPAVAGEPSAEQARAAFRNSRLALASPAPQIAAIEDLVAPGPGGDIPLRLYRGIEAQTGSALPALLFFHSGGWVVGDLETHDVVCRQLALLARCIVIAVDYRLAPEHKFPAAVDDAFAALNFVRAQAPHLGIDASKLAVGGDSAGGNLAAVVALMAKDADHPPLALQALIYPATDFHGSHTSQQKLALEAPPHRCHAGVDPSPVSAHRGGSPRLARITAAGDRPDWRGTDLPGHLRLRSAGRRRARLWRTLA